MAPRRRAVSSRFRRTSIALVVTVVALSVLPSSGQSGAADVGVTATFGSAGSVPDAWGPLVTLRTTGGGYATPVHGTVLPDGRILFMGLERATFEGTGSTDAEIGHRNAFVFTPDTLGTTPPAQITVDSLSQPIDLNDQVIGDWRVNDSLFCAGQTLTSDGQVFTAGGTRSLTSLTTGELRVVGLPYATTFAGGTWTRVPANMGALGPTGTPMRWYPTTTRLPNGRILVTSGFDLVVPSGSVNLSVESFDTGAAAWSTVSSLGQTPVVLINSDYTHAFVLPALLGAYDLVMFGEPGVPVLGSSQSANWLALESAPRPGSEAFQETRRANAGHWDSEVAPDNGASSVLLPIRTTSGEWGYGNGSVLIAGGAHNTQHIQSVDVFDPISRRWRPTLNMLVDRHHPSTVLLPDGRVLIIAGHSEDPNVRHAEYVDPRQGFSVGIGAADGGEVRGYHSVSLLLPDGRVLVAGGRDVSTPDSLEKPTFRYYYPHYMFASRPRILTAPTQLAFGTSFPIISIGARPPAEIVLVSLGSMTHSFDQNQRSVQLTLGANIQIGTDAYLSIAVSPYGAQVAPPGYYMLFVVDGQRIPSIARIVHVG